MRVFHPQRALLACCALLLAVPCVARIRVDVEGVDGAVRRNVLALLSLERYQDRERIEPDAVKRLFRRVDAEVRSALRPFGYYEPQIAATLTPEERTRNWRVLIRIDTGPPVLVTTVDVVVHGPGAEDPVFSRLVATPGMRSGERLEHAAYEQLKGNLLRAASTLGYLDARLERSELAVDTVGRTAAVHLAMSTGERYRFGPTTIRQDAVRASRIRRFLRYQEGEPYDEGLLLRTQFALDDSQYFSTVQVLPGERDTATHTVPVTITTARARRTYSLGAGYGTDTGVRGTFSWLNPRVNSYGHRLRLQVQASQIKQTFDARYDMPFGDPALEKFSLNLTRQQQQISNGIDIVENSIRPSITQVRGRWQRVVSLAAVHTVTTDAVYGRIVDDLIVPGITYASVPEGYLGEALFSRTLYLELLGSHSTLGSNANFLRLDIQSERVLDLTPDWHLLLRGEFGTSAIGNFGRLPAQYRFFAGGDRSVRGFGYDALSPTAVAPDGTIERVGGRHLITGTVELERDLPRSLGAALFFDFGNAFDRFGDPLAYSVGIGVRWRLPVVTVGIDLAQAIRAPGFEQRPGPRLHLNISPRL
ncbi:MAG: BamA/TamA family outer membrane protein [Gammaproteobacteria bacterium]|nr:BamA/TamA family outer membrane protein [Gammaproteobacteria bacterium]